MTEITSRWKFNFLLLALGLLLSSCGFIQGISDRVFNKQPSNNSEPSPTPHNIVVNGQNNTEAPPEKRDFSAQQTSREFLLNFQGCNRTEAEEIACKLMVTNQKSTDRNLYIGSSTSLMMVDSLGNTYYGRKVGYGGTGNYDATLPANIPLLITASFQGVPANARVLTVKFAGGSGSESVTAEFRPIQ